MSVQRKLLQQLSDGELHSGSELAANLGITRSAIWKHIKQLESLDIRVEGQAGQGYRLQSPLELLDKSALLENLGSSARELCADFELLWVSESTSNELLGQPAPAEGKARVCIAEYQSAGRGRRGRHWYAPAGHSVCLSVGWTFMTAPPDFSCLGLAVGIATMRAVQRAGAAGVQLKWPNDVVINNRKLAGVLIDVQGESGGPLHIVAGVGLNYRLSPQVKQAVIADEGLQPAGLIDAVAENCAGRNAVAAFLIDEIITVLSDYAAEGFAPLAAEWNAADSLAGRELDVSVNGMQISGLAKGITADGRLKLDSGDKMHLLVSGDVTLRKGS